MSNYVKITLDEAYIEIDFGMFQSQINVASPVRVKRSQFLCDYIHPKGYIKAVCNTMTPHLNWYFCTPSELINNSFAVSHVNEVETTTIEDLRDKLEQFYIV